ncbi:MAG TPA: class II histone deacetylase [Gaiellaceae bacterium]|nr:class II histone deacetylase [Gaiellaceae bacterium]
MDVFWHDDALRHDTGAGVFEQPPSPLLAEPELHPENAVRIRNMKAILERGPLAPELGWREGRHAVPEELALVHDPAYVESVRAFCAAGGGVLTWSTPVSEGSWPAALAAAGTTLAAVEAVLAGETRLAYALVRPPGHHAQPAQADGYCLFANAALAAERARRAGAERVAVVDWDVHHGNGTQECFYDRPDVLTVSLHMRHGAWGPSHPQTGAPDEVGVGAGEGFNVNVELPPGTGDGGYLRAFADVVAPVVDAFEPELLLVACGQDANQFDPNGRQCVTMDGFRRLGEATRALAERHCDGRLVLVQEGGYARSYSAFCLHATLAGVLGVEQGLEDPCAFMPDDPAHAEREIASVRAALGPYWTL